MTTPRQTRLIRVRDLAAFRATLIDTIATLPLDEARDTAIVVPTHAAAEQLRRSVEAQVLGGPRAAVVWPLLTTRHDLYVELAARLDDPPGLLSAIEREVILAAVAREVAEAGVPTPFDLRPGLIGEILALYDHVHRLGRQIDDFERNLSGELEPLRDTDRGAAQLLDQTRFLTAVYRGYEARLDVSARVDEHVLRDQLIARSPSRPLRRVVLTVGDRLADPDGYWPADLDLLARLPDLRELSVVCTEGLLAAGFLERLHADLPDVEEAPGVAVTRPAPVLVAPLADASGSPRVALSHRDREEELIAVARRIKADRRAGGAPPLHRTALVVRRPLPYLYLARAVFADAGVPFETVDTLPLAAEPYAAALDLVLDLVASDFTRESVLALLRSPHFRLTAPGAEANALSPAVLAACDVGLSEARYLGGLERLTALADEWRAISAPASREERRQQRAAPALEAVLPAARALAPLAEEHPIVDHLATLTTWLRQYDRAPGAGNPERPRRQRVQAAVLGTLDALADACRRHDPLTRADVSSLAITIRRWLGSQTFAQNTGEPGLQILDAQSARYADVDDLQIVGLIEGEWPERPRRSVLYPASLLSLLEPLPATPDPSRGSRDERRAAQAMFRDLLVAPARSVRLSTFALEHDAVVEPSSLLDEVAGVGLMSAVALPPNDRVLVSEALALEPARADLVRDAAAADWAAARLAPSEGDEGRFRGEAGAWRLPRVSVSRLERYLDCPFRFYASEVLRLEEQPEDEDTRTPLERGRFLHELWERFFAAWQARGRGRIEPEDVPDAQALFADLCEDALATLSPSEAALERVRLLGSAVSPGIAHRVFAMEADRPLAIHERLLEYPLEGAFTFRRGDEARVVTLNAKTDRIDVLSDGTLRVIDYKSRKTPDPKLALQLPIYSHVARSSIAATRGGPWPIAEALYLSFEGDKAVVPLRVRGRTIDELIADAEARLLDALDAIAGGSFPPRPARRALCGPCPYRAVCRLEIVEAGSNDDGD